MFNQFKKYSVLSILKKSFLTGLLLLLPLGVTVFVVNLLLEYVGEPASKVVFGWVDIGLRSKMVISSLLSVNAMLVVILVITVIGFISNYFLGKMLIKSAEQIIGRVPGVNTIYKSIKQIVNTFGENRSFSKTVLVEYPRKDCYAIGFVTGDNCGETQEKTGQFVINVFVPTTPNPTSGFLLLIPKKDVIELEMSVSDGMKMVISGGVIVPPYKSNIKIRDKNGRHG